MLDGGTIGSSEESISRNRQEQDNEIVALESIYADLPDTLEYSKNAQGFYEGCMKIRMPKLLNSICIKASDDGGHKKINVSYLPSLSLNFRFTNDYPSKSAPKYKLEAVWLSHASAVRLSSRLDECWEANFGLPILYNWIELLKDEGLNDLYAEEMLDLDKLYKEDRIFAEMHLSAMNALEILRSYDENATLSAFEDGWYDCEVCCTSTSGKDAIQFMPCKHAFCVNCVASFFRQKINDNSVKTMQCLMERCESNATQAQIKRVLTEAEFERYDKLLLEGALDVMTDVIQCPRMICRAPVIVEIALDDDLSCRNLARCPACDYAFCSICRKTYHGLEPCDLTKEQRDQLIAQYEHASPEQQEEICRKMGGRKQLEKYLTAIKSEIWIKENSKQCPSCHSSIEKKEGCNKMICTKCHHCFCWLCGASLNTKNPYEHFRIVSSGCFNRLFEGVILDEEFMDEFPVIDDDR